MGLPFLRVLLEGLEVLALLLFTAPALLGRVRLVVNFVFPV